MQNVVYRGIGNDSGCGSHISVMFILYKICVWFRVWIIKFNQNQQCLLGIIQKIITCLNGGNGVWIKGDKVWHGGEEGGSQQDVTPIFFICMSVCMYVCQYVCVCASVCVWSALWSGSEGVETLCTPLIHISPELPNI